MVHTSVKHMKPSKDESNQYITSEFSGMMLDCIMRELFSIKQEHSGKFGEVILCLDNKTKDGYWRNDVYPQYKANRKNAKDVSEVNFQEVFSYTNKLIEQIEKNLPWKVVSVAKAEADDIMLVLAREYSRYEKILIHSPDKDMIQAQRDTENVYQYSSLTKKWLVAEHKSDDMDQWITEHVVLGDASDGVPRIIDGTVFSESFKKYLSDNNHEITTPIEFRESSIPDEEKIKLITEFDVYIYNRKKENTGVKDIYLKERFGPSTLKKAILEAGSLDEWLDSHPSYRDNYNRNFVLVMEEGIPVDIWNQCILFHKTAIIDYNSKEFENYLSENNLGSLLMELPNHFKLNRSLTADDFGW